jgi:DNA end-binding protein Ku
LVPKKEIDEPYLNSPYYLVPDGEVGQQAFTAIREAIRKEGMVALGRVVFTSREHRGCNGGLCEELAAGIKLDAAG